MISTHVLDTSNGNPAAGIGVLLEKKSGVDWSTVANEKTNADGRIVFGNSPEAGTYRLTFQTAEYYVKKECFFPYVPVTFTITDTKRKYHVPLLLSPYGYSTYRGS
jgi:5-hydroxyisourate hydrolase